MSRSNKRWRAVLALVATASVALTATATPPASALPHPGAPASTLHADAAAPAGPGTSPVSPGYWLGAADGGVYAFGTGNLGQARPAKLDRPVVGTAPTPDGHGYWLVASDGGVFSYGDATFHGSTGAITLNKPIVGMASTPDGGGYWLVAADGGIFTFGDARFLGSTGALPLAKPIVGMAATRDGLGYWLVASDGGIFGFGDALFHGSTGNLHLNQPVVGMAATPTGGGYWMVASDGGIFTFGDADYQGSTGDIALTRPIVGMAAAPGGGYWLVASDGGIFTFGAAPFLGSTGRRPGPAPVVGIAATAHGAQYPAGAIGADYSFPECSGGNGGYPAAGNPVSIVGVGGGLSTRNNPCFASEAANAGANLTVYINVDNVSERASSPAAANGPAGTCSSGDTACANYNWGYNNTASQVAYAHSKGYAPTLWWLDVEGPANSGNPLWSPDTSANAATIHGAVDALHAQGLTAGIYSTYLQWPQITGYATDGSDALNFPELPIWIAWAPADGSQATTAFWSSICSNGHFAFAGGTPWLVQWLGGATPAPPTSPHDGNYACSLG